MAEKSVKSEIYFYLRGVKSIEQLKRVIVKELTHGNAFRYMDQPEFIATAHAEAEQLAGEMIQRNMDAIPLKIKQG